jgi:arylsulfatase A-like enzyme
MAYDIERVGWRLALAFALLPSCDRPQLGGHGGAPSAASATAPSSAPKSTPAPEPQRPRVASVVLITVDALRPDQPWAGNEELLTPHLSRLAAKSVVYTRAYALAHFTTASLNGMLASRYPSELVRTMCHLGGYDIPNSLAPTLQKAGVATFAAHGHAIFAGNSAPRAGFDEWQLIRGAAGRMQTKGAVTGADIAQLLSGYLEREPPAKKQFAWAHFVDPHHSYVSHPDFPARSTAPRAVYDSEVAYTDSVIGGVLDSIARSGRANTTAIIVTADHGEAFGEHGSVYHGSSLHEEEVRVPLIVFVPGVKPKTIDTPRSAIDLAPTIAALLDIEAPATWRGQSLLSDLEGRAPETRAVVIDVPAAATATAKRAVIRDNIKVILVGNSAEQVFDLKSDPQERAPLDGDRAASATRQVRSDLQTIRSVTAAPCEGSPRGVAGDEGI